ncbi:NADP-dependent oxidoreductase domain-containing protein [Mycena capillaripes]|nr:NADP-dependent oxidoreductase domain-containing protein [Mycena capillaripes]
MSIGDKWGHLGMGAMNKESSFKLLDAYFDNGGSFIHTANSYQEESSESFIGEWAEKRNQAVTSRLATIIFAQKLNYVGNNLKSLHVSVDTSLKKLRITYIDILYVYWWDWNTSVAEVMDGLHNLVVQGKVLYLVRAFVFSSERYYRAANPGAMSCLKKHKGLVGRFAASHPLPCNLFVPKLILL